MLSWKRRNHHPFIIWAMLGYGIKLVLYERIAVSGGVWCRIATKDLYDLSRIVKIWS